MVLTPKNSYVAETTVSRKPSPALRAVAATTQRSEAELSPQQVKEYAVLKERFLRTTNALASAAHDLKTPLAILNGYVELLQSEKLGDLNDRQREVMGDMRSNGQRLQHFIRGLSQLTACWKPAKSSCSYETGDLNACLSEVCRLVVSALSGAKAGALFSCRTKN